MKKNLTLIALVILSFSLNAQIINDTYRPAYHYSSKENWLNDPNGLIYVDGIYHMFYQYNPFGNNWGNMSWGHATSDDLIHWQEHDVAIPYENGVMAFSGCAVFDKNNTSGLGENGTAPLVAIYTGMIVDNGIQDQRLAYSNDAGQTWNNYIYNPIIDIGSNEFRDPKIIWHEASEKWIMVVSRGAEKQIGFYSSGNLIDWVFLQDFGPIGTSTGAWECPDLFPLAVNGDLNNQKWVLVHSIGPGNTRYYLGDFDGEKFVWENNLDIKGEIIESFESVNLDNWEIEGEAFGNLSTTGSLPGQQIVGGYMGDYYINSYHGGDVSQGKVTSPIFTIKKDFISFLIGGGECPNKACINLVVEDSILFSTTGLNSESLVWSSWDVSNIQGVDAKIEILDSSTGSWGHLNVDHIIQTDSPCADENTGIIDYGLDFYALQSFSDIPSSDGRRIWLSWMNNWMYANDLPTVSWKGIMSMPREVKLKDIGGELRLAQNVVNEYKQLRSDSIVLYNVSASEISKELKTVSFKSYEIEAEVQLGNLRSFELILKKGRGQETKIVFDIENNEVVFDRSKSGKMTLNEDFRRKQKASLLFEDEVLDIQIFVDNCSVELFLNGGVVVFSNQIFPDSTSNAIELIVDNVEKMFEKFKVYNLSPSVLSSNKELLETKSQSYVLSPNPTKDYLNIKTNNYIKNGDYWQLYSLTGKLVSSGDLSNVIDMRSCVSGMYIICLVSNELTETYTVIKE